MSAADFLNDASRRRLAVTTLLTVALLCAWAGAARAGTYTVVGCDGSGRIDGWVPIQNAGYGAAYVDGCPRANGLVARSVGRADTSRAPYLATALWAFVAPAGTRIVALSGEYKGGAYWPWTSGIFNIDDNQWQLCFTWCHNGWPLCTVNCPSPITSWRPLDIEGLSAHAIALRTMCMDPAGCLRNGDNYGAAYLSNSAVRLADDRLPTVRISGGSLVTAGWKRASQTLAYSLSDNAGIRTVRILIDGVAVSRDDRVCDTHRVIPCSNVAATVPLDTLRVFPGDGRHVISVVGTDGGYNVASASRTVWIDNTPPGQPQNLRVAGLETWKSANSFTASWTPPQVSGAPIAATRYQLCPVGSTAGCTGAQQPGAGSTLNAFRLPGDGEWTLRVWQVDAAGNEDPNRSAVATPLRLDTTAPNVGLAPPSPGDPARLHVAASDATSGLAQVAVEIRRHGSDAWLPVQVTGAGGAYSAFVDDERLRSGVYDVRARAVDAAGNERSATAFVDGRAATLALPARIVSRLASGQPRGRGPSVRLARSVVTTLGRRPLIRGRLTTPGPNPIGDAQLEVWRRIDLTGAVWRRAGEITTTQNGRFSYRVPRGPNSILIFHYPGTATVRGSTARVSVHVRASTTMHASPRHAVNGEYVRFHGRLRGGRIPAGGKLVELQVFTRRRWRTFAQPRANRRGRWSYDYRFETISGHVAFRFRARIRREEAYPFAYGRSRTIRVWVTGL